MFNFCIKRVFNFKTFSISRGYDLYMREQYSHMFVHWVAQKSKIRLILHYDSF